MILLVLTRLALAKVLCTGGRTIFAHKNIIRNKWQYFTFAELIRYTRLVYPARAGGTQ